MAFDLRGERLDRGKSLIAAAKEMGVSETVLLRAEKHGTRPHPSNALKIAKFFGVRPSEIWSGS